MDFITIYPWLKSFHIIAVIAWMAGLLYLPRLFVYHCQVDHNSEAAEKFRTMERKLLRGIMNPSMIVVFALGFWLAKETEYYKETWFHIKLLLVVLLAGAHGMMSKFRKDFEKGQNKKSERFYRIFNEIPAVIMVITVLLTVLKP